jgi:hypothetical protein
MRFQVCYAAKSFWKSEACGDWFDMRDPGAVLRLLESASTIRLLRNEYRLLALFGPSSMSEFSP